MDELSRDSDYDLICDVIKPRSKIRKFMVWNFKSRDQLSLSWQWWKKKRLQVSDHHFWRFSTHENFQFWHFYSKFLHFLETVLLKKIKNLMKICIFRSFSIFLLSVKISESKNIFECDFERNDWCELEDFLDGDFQIRKNNGKTTTPLTGIVEPYLTLTIRA